MPEPKPPQPTAWSPEENDKFDGLRGKYYPELMRQKAPGLYEKISRLKEGEVLNLTLEEREFLIELIMADEKGISGIVHDISGKIWGAWSVEWKQEGKYHRENTMAALWWHFCSSNLSRDRVANLVDFFFGTTKEQAEAEIATWKEWQERGKTQIKLIK